MKAQILYKGGDPFSLEDRPDPTPGPGEAVAKVIACGSGLTIHHIKAGRGEANFPIIIGHEITGEIVEVGSGGGGPDNLKVGDPVTAYFYLIDGEDKWTRNGRAPISTVNKGYIGRQIDGGYAEYIKLPVYNFIKLPEGLDYKNKPAEVGVISDAIATPYKVLSRARVAATDTVAIFGAGGGLGVHQVMMCKWAHANVIAIDVMKDKLDVCLGLGADLLVDASEDSVVDQVMDLTNGQGVDVAIDYVSTTGTQQQAVDCLGIGGRFVTLGGSLQPFMAPAPKMLSKELELMGSRYCSRQQVIESLELCARGDVWPLVTETYPLAEAETVHKRLDQGLVTGRAALIIES
ncbi:MAG: alcohol dehydrogenase catalytic domain-containing protein [Alphaproteobacteria bacterium]